MQFNDSFKCSNTGSMKKLNKGLGRTPSDPDMHISTYNLWNAKSKEEEKIFKAIRNSQIFSDKRVETFVSFNYRNCESKSINYQNTFEKVLAPKSGKNGVRYHHGTMHVSDLWSQKQMLQIIGNLPYPKDRLKILNSYKLRQMTKLKPVKRNTYQRKSLLP